MRVIEGTKDKKKPSLLDPLFSVSARVGGGKTGKVILVLDEIGLKCMDNWNEHSIGHLNY